MTKTKSMKPLWFSYVALLLIAGCSSPDEPTLSEQDTTDEPVAEDTGADTDAPSTDVDLNVDVDLNIDVQAMLNSGYAFCASGGPVSDGRIGGVTCLSPLALSGSSATDGNLIWTPGPLGRIYE